MFKKIFRSLSEKVSSGLARFSPQDHSQFFFISLLVVVAITALGFFPLFGINGLFIKNLILPIFGGFLLIVIALQSLKNGYFTLPDKRTSWTLFVVLLVTLISSVFATAPRNALFGTLSGAPSFALILSLVIIFYIAYVSFKKFSHILGLLLVMSGVYIITFLHVVLRVIFGAKFLSFGFLNTLTGSLIGSWTDFALFSLLMLILSIICLEMGKFVRTAKWITTTVAVFGIIGLFLANISWIWILAGAVLIIVTIYIFSLAYWNTEKSSYEKGRPAPWYSLIAFIIVLVGFLFGGVIMSPITKVRSLAYNELYPNAKATMQAGFASLKERPITGVGLSGFDHAWNKIKPVGLSGSSSGSTEFSTGYSFVSTVVATTGILGLLVFLALAFLFIIQFYLIFRKGFEDSAARFAGMLVIASAILLSLITLIDYPGITLLVLWAVFLGALWGIAHDNEAVQVSFVHDPRTSFFGILSVLVLIFVGGAFVYVTVRQTASVFAYSSSLRSFANSNRPAGISKLVSANQLWATDFYNRTLANQTLVEVQNLNPDSGMSKDALSREVQRVLSVGMSYADVSTKLDSKNYRNWVSLGNVYQFFAQLKVEGAGDRAKEAYDKAKELSPNDRTLDLLFANLAETLGDVSGAKSIVQDSIKNQPTVDAYLWLYQRDIAAKDYGTAEKHLVGAAQLDSTNAGILTELGTLYFVQGSYSNAIAMFERSLTINRNQPITFAYLGVAYESVGKTDQANQVFDFLKKQLPKDAESLIAKVRAQKGGSVTPTIETPAEETSASKAQTETQPVKKIEKVKK